MIQMFGVLNILDICNQQIDMKIAYSVRNKNNRRFLLELILFKRNVLGNKSILFLMMQ